MSALEKFGEVADEPAELLCQLLLAPEAAEPLDELDGVWALVLLLGLLDCAEVEPLDCAAGLQALPDELWAKEALDSASRAAAVALARIFRFIGCPLKERLSERNAAVRHASAMPVTFPAART